MTGLPARPKQVSTNSDNSPSLAGCPESTEWNSAWNSLSVMCSDSKDQVLYMHEGTITERSASLNLQQLGCMVLVSIEN